MSFDQAEIFELLKQLVAIRSYPGEEGAVQQAIVDWFVQQGLQPILQPTENGQPNVIVRVENGDGPALLLNGHVDTVLAAEGWKCDPWQGERDGDLFYGLGAGDMKSGVVINMLVTRELARRKDQWSGTLIFSSVTDEEAYSAGAHALIDSGITVDACIVTEPFHQPVCIGSAGKLLVKVEVIGKAAHGFFPEQGINAAIEAARFVAGVFEAIPLLQHAKIPASQTILSFHSGSQQYVVTLPERATVLVSRQLVPGETSDSVISKMRAFAESLQSPARFEFTVAPPYYPPWEFEIDHQPLAQSFGAAFEQIYGQEPAFGYTAGVSDANLFSAELGVPTIQYGVRSGAWHQCNEWVDLATIAPCAQVVAETALRFLAG